MPALPHVFVDIDTQFDFMDPAGKLYVPGAEHILGPLERLFAHAVRQRVPVLSSVDEHAPDDPEFRQWPPHCVCGTPGQKKLPVTLMANAMTIPADRPPFDAATLLLSTHGQLIFPKPTLDAFDNPNFAALVDALDVGEYVVFGVATDYCVRLAARGLLERGRRVKIVEDAVRGIGPESEARIRDELTALGAAWVSTADVVAGTA